MPKNNPLDTEEFFEKSHIFACILQKNNTMCNIYLKNMNITRNHIIILAVISIFTGMIAPTVSGIDLARPYAMTNMQYVAY